MSPLLPSSPKSTNNQGAKRHSLWPVTLITGLIVIFIGWWFFWRPAWQELQSLPEISSYEDAKKIAQNELADLNKMNEEFSRLNSNDRTRLDIALPQGQDLPNLLTQLEGLVKASNFSITDISFSADKENKPATGNGIENPSTNSEVKILKISLTVEGGDYDELKQFVNNIEQSLRLLQVTSLSFSAKEANATGNVYNLNLRTVYLP